MPGFCCCCCSFQRHVGLCVTVVVISSEGILNALRGKATPVHQNKDAISPTLFKTTNLATVSTNLRHIGLNPSRLAIGESSTHLPCVLASTRQLTTDSDVAVAVCRKHGLASYLSLEEIEYSEDYTRIMFRSPKSQVVHRYNDCVLEFHDQNQRTSSLRRSEGHVFSFNNQALKDGYLVYIEEKCKMCKKSLKGKDTFMHRESRFCSIKCRSDELVLNFEQYMMLEDPWPYIRRRRSSKNNRPVEFSIND